MLFVLSLQKCFLSYTGFNGKVHSTMQGHGWNNKGIKAFNDNLVAVIEDRETLGEKFDNEMIDYCKEVLKGDNGKSVKEKRKYGGENPTGTRAKCLKVQVFIRERKNNNSNNSITTTNNNSNSNDNSNDNEEVETVFRESMKADDHLVG